MFVFMVLARAENSIREQCQWHRGIAEGRGCGLRIRDSEERAGLE